MQDGLQNQLVINESDMARMEDLFIAINYIS
jgi:hypothetical protein